MPEGLLADSGWLEGRGFSRQLRSHYASEGWLEQVAHGVYRRPAPALQAGQEANLTWDQVVASLQLVMHWPVVLGGATALDVHGYSHYLSVHGPRRIHLYSPKSLPGWLGSLPLQQEFVTHNPAKLFSAPLPADVVNRARHGRVTGVTVRPSRDRGLPLVVSSPERALLELLAEAPKGESLHLAAVVMEGLTNLNPAVAAELLRDCRSIKAKRLFFVFADRAGHAWLKHLDRTGIDLGVGKRVLGKGGKLDPTYLITLPGEFDGDQ